MQEEHKAAKKYNKKKKRKVKKDKSYINIQ